MDPFPQNPQLPPGVFVQPGANVRPDSATNGIPPGNGQPVIVIQQAPPPRGSAWGWIGGAIKLLMYALPLLLIMGVLGSIAGGGPDPERVMEKYYSGDRAGVDKVAILRFEGTILEGEGYAKKQIDAVLEDKAIKAVVLRIDSPGGTVTASDYILHHLKKLREKRAIPMIVSMGSIAASGGYYIAMGVGDQEKCIYAEPTTWTGSIGVIIPHYDFSGLMDRFEVTEDSIASHRLKGMGSPTKKMTEEERQILQSLVNESFQRFKEIVQSGRPAFRGADGEQRLTEVATGQVFTAQQAKDKGLVDEIGFIEEAIERAAEAAGLTGDKVKVVEYERPNSLRSILMGSAQAQKSLQLEDLLLLNTPKAYYLFCAPGQNLLSGQR